jgi:hypothetical protein
MKHPSCNRLLGECRDRVKLTVRRRIVTEMQDFPEHVPSRVIIRLRNLAHQKLRLSLDIPTGLVNISLGITPVTPSTGVVGGLPAGRGHAAAVPRRQSRCRGAIKPAHLCLFGSVMTLLDVTAVPGSRRRHFIGLIP